MPSRSRLPAPAPIKIALLLVLLSAGLPGVPVVDGYGQVASSDSVGYPGEHRVQVFYSLRSQSTQLPIARRAIAVDLQQAPIGVALDRVARAVGLRLTYSIDILPPQRMVNLQARRIPVGTALLDILEGTDLDIMISPDGDAVVVR